MTSARPAPPPARGTGRGRPSLLRQSGLTGVAATASLLAALALDLSIAYSYGAGASTDAYFGGARIPVAAAAVALVAANQGLVPTFGSWTQHRGERAAERYAGELVTLVVVVSAVAAAALAAAAPVVVYAIAPGFDAATRDLAVTVLRVSSLTVPLAVLSEALRGYLNAQYSFIAPALVNVLLSGVAAAVVLLGDGPVVLVAWATVAGGVVRAVVLLWLAGRRGLRPWLPVRRPSPEVMTALRRLRRPVVTGGLPPVARLGEVVLLSLLPAGALSIMSYASRLVSGLGGTVFLRSISVALVPRMTSAAARSDVAEQRRILRRGRLLMLAVSLPLAAGIVVAAAPASLLLFRRGEFGPDEVVLLAMTLAVLALSLPADAVGRATLTPFFASLDTRTPLRNALVGAVTNLVLLAVLVGALTVLVPDGSRVLSLLGAAVAVVVAQCTQALHAARSTRRLLGGVPFVGHRRALCVLVAACVLACAVSLLLGDPAGRAVSPGLLGATAAGLALLAVGSLVAWRGGVGAGLDERGDRS